MYMCIYMYIYIYTYMYEGRVIFTNIFGLELAVWFKGLRYHIGSTIIPNITLRYICGICNYSSMRGLGP